MPVSTVGQVAEGAQEQQSAEHQHQRHGDLHRHQRAPQPQSLVAGAAAAQPRNDARVARIAGALPKINAVGDRRSPP